MPERVRILPVTGSTRSGSTNTAALRAALAAADGVLFCTPEYAGALPGSFKNLLDWTVGGGEMYGQPVAWIYVAADGRRENGG